MIEVLIKMFLIIRLNLMELDTSEINSKEPASFMDGLMDDCYGQLNKKYKQALYIISAFLCVSQIKG